MDNHQEHKEFDDVYVATRPAKMATFVILLHGKPKLDSLNFEESDDFEHKAITEVDSDETLTDDSFPSDTKIEKPQCEFDPAKDRYPKSTLLIYNSRAPPEFKMQDMTNLSNIKNANKPRKSLDFIRLNKQLLRHMKKPIQKKEADRVCKGSSLTTPSLSTSAQVTTEENVKTTNATSTLQTPTRSVVRHVSITPTLQSIRKEQARISQAKQQSAIIDFCLKKANGQNSLLKSTFPSQSSQSTPLRITRTTLPKTSLSSAASNEEEFDGDNGTTRMLTGVNSLSHDSSSEANIERPPSIPSEERTSIKQCLLEQHEAQQKNNQQQRRRRPRPKINEKPSRNYGPNNSSSMSLNISSTCSDDSSLEYTDEEFNYVPYSW